MADAGSHPRAMICDKGQKYDPFEECIYYKSNNGGISMVYVHYIFCISSLLVMEND